MSHSAIVTAASVLSLALGAYTWFNNRKYSKLSPLPPGPKKRPFIGNLLDLPTSEEWITYDRWCRELKSDIVHIEAVGQSIIILNSLTAATELLDKRSLYYSGRPRSMMAGELMGWKYTTGLLQYGDEWKMHRRFMHTTFSATESVKLQPHEVMATHNLLRRLIKNPNDIMMHLRRWAGSLIIRVTYGIEVLDDNDPYIHAAEDATRAAFRAIIPGAFLVDFFPLLKYVPAWVPGAGFKKKADEWRELKETMFNNPFNETQRRMESGVTTPSLTLHGLQRMSSENDQVHRDALKQAAGTTYGAGSDTTASAVGSCILALLENPAILEKAQDQIEHVVGHERLPTFDDLDELPYITAIAKEALRWRAIAPIGAPHVVERDDTYQGYRIPAKSIVLANIWAILHDETTYPDPLAFKPERYLCDDGRLDASVLDPAQVAFGFGRRICPGRYMSFSSIWINIASLLAAFDIRKATDEEGNPIPLSHEYLAGLAVIPASFPCSITPRSKKMEELIMETGRGF